MEWVTDNWKIDINWKFDNRVFSSDVRNITWFINFQIVFIVFKQTVLYEFNWTLFSGKAILLTVVSFMILFLITGPMSLKLLNKKSILELLLGTKA